MAELVVSLDPVAALREKRRAAEPDPVAAGLAAELAGAAGIAVQLRADRRGIQERDVRILREVLKTRLHLALAPTTESVKVAYTVKPDLVVLIPERHDEASHALGLDVMLNQAQLKKLVRSLREGGLPVALFVDPDADQVRAAKAVEASAVFLNTRLYADAREKEAQDELHRLGTAAQVGRKIDLKVICGHGLDHRNLRSLAALRDVDVLELGHAVAARALMHGFDRAVRELVAAIARP